MYYVFSTSGVLGGVHWLGNQLAQTEDVWRGATGSPCVVFRNQHAEYFTVTSKSRLRSTGQRYQVGAHSSSLPFLELRYSCRL